jgi:HK97 family phage major capsid protein
MSVELKVIQDEIKTVWSEMKGVLDSQAAEIKTLGGAKAETTDTITKLNARIDELEVKAKRPGQSTGSETKSTERKDAFLKWARHGDVLSPDERKFLTPTGGVKALTRVDDTTGGYLASPEITQEIIKGIVEFSPVRNFARVRTTSAHSIKVRKRTGTFSAAWTNERGSRTETTGLTYGMEDLPAHEMYALVDVSLQDLEDSDFDLEAELRMEFQEQFGVAEGTAFVSGSSNGKPEGVLTNADVSETVSGSAALITADGLIAIFYDLKDAYAQNAAWGLKRSTIKAIRQLKDANNQYLWAPGLAGGAPATILDRPYFEATDMPAIAANAYPVAFGDWRRGYTIADRIQIEVQRDPFTQPGFVRFHARKRVGGQVVLAEAIRKLKISA